MKLVKEPEVEAITVTEDNLSDYVGKPVFTDERMYATNPVGVVMGLAWNSMGGTTLYIESTVSHHEIARNGKAKATKEGEEDEKAASGGSLMVTGMMGDVMKESTQIAYTVAKDVLYKMDPSNDFFFR